ncbi:MAG: amidohydrolase family protein [Phycisphaerales bacterium]|nr:amidohydrolase family protein [Phycisphaerales bacterium]MCB9864416.1 amidohydrolase family protein [Phycisphaerales bacterium]
MRTAIALTAGLLLASTFGLGPFSELALRAGDALDDIATRPDDPESQPSTQPESQPTTEPASQPASQPTTTQAADSQPASDAASQPAEPEDSYFALVGGIVHTIAGPDMRGATILSKNGRIIDIGYRVEIPKDAEILDVKGYHVYPGIVACEARGMVGSDPPEDSTNVFGTILRLANAGGITTVFTRDTAAKASYGNIENIPLRSGLFESIRVGSPSQKREFREQLEKARDYLRKVEAYERAKADGDDDAKKPDDPKGFEQALKLIKKDRVAYITANDKNDLVFIADIANEFGVQVVISGASEGWTVADRLGRAGVKVIVTPRRQSGADPQMNQPTGNNIQNASVLYDHGVDIAITSQSAGISLVGLAGNDMQHLPMEAAFAVRGGLSESAAIEAITLGAARVLGIDDRVGSIEIGKDADLIVTDGPLLDFYTIVQWTIVSGDVVYDKADESLFAHIRPRTPTTQPASYKFWPRPFKHQPPPEPGASSRRP